MILIAWDSYVRGEIRIPRYYFLLSLQRGFPGNEGMYKPLLSIDLGGFLI